MFGVSLVSFQLVSVDPSEHDYSHSATGEFDMAPRDRC
jgi:hypothetical protein